MPLVPCAKCPALAASPLQRRPFFQVRLIGCMRLVAPKAYPAEASLVAQVLMEQGITKESIIQEPEATTTAETLWFSLRWLPEGTGKIYIITSEFNMPRALYIFQEATAETLRGQLREVPLKVDGRGAPGS